jgi:hypothetical protein
VLGEEVGGGGEESDAVLLCFDFPGDADDHGCNLDGMTELPNERN